MVLFHNRLADKLIGENHFIHLDLIVPILNNCRSVFPNVQYAYTNIATYPGGQIGFAVCSKDKSLDLKNPLRRWTPEKEEELLKYYNADIHKASFILPTFARVALR